MTYTIDKGKPFPKREAKYPWQKLDKGDSFFVPLGDCSTKSLQNQASTRGLELGWVFKARAVEEDGVKGTRVWRLG